MILFTCITLIKHFVQKCELIFCLSLFDSNNVDKSVQVQNHSMFMTSHSRVDDPFLDVIGRCYTARSSGLMRLLVPLLLLNLRLSSSNSLLRNEGEAHELGVSVVACEKLKKLTPR